MIMILIMILVAFSDYPVSQKVGHLYFYDSAKVDRFSHFFTVRFRKDLWRKAEVNYHLPLNLLPHYLAKC